MGRRVSVHNILSLNRKHQMHNGSLYFFFFFSYVYRRNYAGIPELV